MSLYLKNNVLWLTSILLIILAKSSLNSPPTEKLLGPLVYCQFMTIWVSLPCHPRVSLPCHPQH